MNYPIEKKQFKTTTSNKNKIRTHQTCFFFAAGRSLMITPKCLTADTEMHHKASATNPLGHP